MHEWSLAESVVSSVSEFARKKNLKRIAEIDIAVGEIENLDRKTVDFVIKELTKGNSLFKDFRLKMTTDKTKLRCSSCKNEWTFSFGKFSGNERKEFHFHAGVPDRHVKCPKCRSMDFEIISGRGITVKSVTGE